MGPRNQTVSLKVVNLNRKRKIDTNYIENLARIVLKKILKNKRKLNINIIFVTNTYIKRLNKIYRQKNYATDVLSFCISKSQTDVFISSEMAAYNSKRFKTSFKKELTLYVIHGILHMLGFRDNTVYSKKKMDKTQKKILAQLT